MKKIRLWSLILLLIVTTQVNPLRMAEVEASSTVEPLLSESLPVNEAIDEVGKRTLRRANPQLDASEFEAVIADDSVYADPQGRLYYVDSLPERAEQPTILNSVTPQEAALVPSQSNIVDEYSLESRPGAPRTIYLDFGGETVTGTAWNVSYSSGKPLYAEPFDRDANYTSFGVDERIFIYDVWRAVSEDYAPFNVNVVTKKPAADKLIRSNALDQEYGTTMVITQPYPVNWPANLQAGGIAYVGVFNLATNSNYYSVGWAFAESYYTPHEVAGIISHEVGHQLGLVHDGGLNNDGDSNIDEYYNGHNDERWAPIMGSTYGHTITQFSNGDYANSFNKSVNMQDDFAVMDENGLDYMTDDHGETLDTATTISYVENQSVEGLIGQRNDIDAFKFSLNTSKTVQFVATPDESFANVDLAMSLYNSSGVKIAESNPMSSNMNSMNYADATSPTYMSASLLRTLNAGTYFITIDGVGDGDIEPYTTGYSDYGSVGRYSLKFGAPKLSVEVRGFNSTPSVAPITSLEATFTCTTYVSCESTPVDTGKIVWLAAKPIVDGYRFAGWSGPCYAYYFDENCRVTVEQQRKVVALYEPSYIRGVSNEEMTNQSVTLKFFGAYSLGTTIAYEGGTPQRLYYGDVFEDEGNYVAIYSGYVYDSETRKFSEERVEFMIDKTIPELEVGEPSTTNFTKLPVTFNLSALDRLSGLKSITAQGGTVSGTTLTVTQNGTVDVTATDHAGNTHTKSVVVNNIDTKPPSVSFGEPSPKAFTNQQVTFNLTIADDVSGVKSVTATGGTLIDNKLTVTNNGTVSVTVIDNVGNTTTQSKVVSNIDKVAPTFTLGQPSTVTMTNQSVTFNITASDSQSGIKSITAIGGVVSGTKLIVASNGTVQVTATDNAGNKKSVTVEVSNIDKTAPTLSITSPISTSPTNKSVNYTVTASDVGFGLSTVTVSGGKLEGSKWTIPYNGTYTVTAKDKAGNSTSRTVSVSNIDTMPPLISGVANEKTYSKSTGVKPTFESTATGTISKDSGSPSTFSSGTKITAVGTYVLKVKDRAGNISTVKFYIK